MVMIAGDVACAAIFDCARRVAEAVPDRLTLAVLTGGALDLVGRRRRAPCEPVWKAGSRYRCHLCTTPLGVRYASAYRTPALTLSSPKFSALLAVCAILAFRIQALGDVGA